jgi:hypothetical protein
MTALQEFPDVDPGEIESAGHQFQTASSSLSTAASSVRGVAGTSSWRSPSAKPAWDSAVEARASDIGNAHDVMTHVGNVLRTAGSELAKAKSEYDAAKFMMLIYPDPRAGSITGSASDLLLNPLRPAPAVDPEALRQYEAQVRKANDAVDDAEYVLALCARELMAVSTGVTFAPLPTGGAPRAVDPGTFAIIPFAPAFGAPSGALFANGIPVPLAKGRAFETQILKELGITGSKNFFRPDKYGNYNLPRTRSGTLYRGTFPDSMRGGVLEIKSGTTEISIGSPQIRLQLWVARTLNQPYNLITDSDTQVDPALLKATQGTGGSVYSRVPGNESTFYDRNTGEYVRLQGGTGPDADQLARTPITQEEAARISAAVRSQVESTSKGLGGIITGGGSEPAEPSLPGPSSPYVTEQEYDEAWSKADISPEGDTPLPGMPEEEVPGAPLEEPIEPMPIEPVEPIEPIIPFEEIIP